MTETTEIYLKREEISNVEETIKSMLADLRTATESHKGKIQYNQVVMQLNKDDRDNKSWKMFVYFEYESSSFYCSFQDDYYYDTDFDYNYTIESMTQHMMDEIKEVGDFEWIARDID